MMKDGTFKIVPFPQGPKASAGFVCAGEFSLSLAGKLIAGFDRSMCLACARYCSGTSVSRWTITSTPLVSAKLKKLVLEAMSYVNLFTKDGCPPQ
jgi:hypothetical protein